MFASKTKIQRIQAILRLSFSLAKTNFKLRNEGSYLGVLWYILNPLALFFIILFVKNSAFDGHNIAFYPVYLLVGLLMFNLLTHIVSSSITIIPSNAGFIKSVKIPTESLVISKVLQFLFSHMFEIVLLWACLLYVGLPSVGILFYIMGLIPFLLFITGLAFMCATLGAHISDLGNVWTVISQLLFFITPIFYMPVEGSFLYSLNQFNPLYIFIQAGRSVLIQNQLPTLGEGSFIAILSIVVLVAGLAVFRTYKERFAELV